MPILSDSFIKTIRRRVNDCVNPIQLRNYLDKYKSYVFTPLIKQAFESRLAFLKDRFVADEMFSTLCDEISEDLELEIKISAICSDNLFDPRVKKISHDKVYYAHINLVDFDPYNLDCTETEAQILRQVFEVTHGDKIDICKILDIDNTTLNNKISMYDLKEYLNSIRKRYRSKIPPKMRE